MPRESRGAGKRSRTTCAQRAQAPIDGRYDGTPASRSSASLEVDEGGDRPAGAEVGGLHRARSATGGDHGVAPSAWPRWAAATYAGVPRSASVAAHHADQVAGRGPTPPARRRSRGRAASRPARRRVVAVAATRRTRGRRACDGSGWRRRARRGSRAEAVDIDRGDRERRQHQRAVVLDAAPRRRRERAAEERGAAPLADAQASPRSVRSSRAPASRASTGRRRPPAGRGPRATRRRRAGRGCASRGRI